MSNVIQTLIKMIRRVESLITNHMDLVKSGVTFKSEIESIYGPQ